jgi:acetolactate synthase-1/3 small subunit
MSTHIISVLVEDHPGVLTRMTGMFTRRGINIESLTVSPCEKEGFSRMTIAIKGEKFDLEKVEKQLNRLVEVVKVTPLERSMAIVRDLCLLRVTAKDAAKRAELMQMASAYNAKIVDASTDTLTFEIVDDPVKIDKFIAILKNHGIKLLFRTGVTAISRDEKNGQGYEKEMLPTY